MIYVACGLALVASAADCLTAADEIIQRQAGHDAGRKSRAKKVS